ncbi:MAG: type IV secretion system protein [Synergistaceae bacterium]|jgi:P-type conjugative transfer protein TrbL|nr:type IV secretion system protein [Synergistaceae bacterium]
MKISKIILGAVFAGVLFSALPLPEICEAAEPSVLVEIYNTVEGYRGTWLKKLGGLMWWTFASLLSISFVWQASQMVLAESFSFGSMIGLVVRTGMYGGFFKWIFNNPDYVTLIPDSFMKLSELVTGYKVEIFSLLNIAGQMLDTLSQAAQALSWYMAIVGSLAIITVNVMLYAIVGIILMLKIEVVMVSLAGFSLLVFCGLNQLMADYAMTYVKALIGCGLKLFMCGIIGGMLQDFCNRFITMLSADNTGFMTAVGVMLGILVVLWIIVSNIPNYVSAIFYGVPAGSAGAAWSSAVTFASMVRGGTTALGGVGNVAENSVGGLGLLATQLYQKLSGDKNESAGNSVIFSNPNLASNRPELENSSSRRDADGS